MVMDRGQGDQGGHGQEHQADRGNLRRWEKLPAVWRRGWRSVHYPDHAQITAEFLMEGAGLAVAQRTWPAGADFTGGSVPAGVAARVVPGLCRTAVEAAFTEAIWRRELRAGRGHAEIEDDLAAASTRLNLLASLALTGDASKGGEVLPRLDAWGHRFADTYKALNKGAHVPHDGDLGLLTGDARRLAGKIRGMLS
jgi:hypothetical protein